MNWGTGGEQLQYCFLAYCARGVVSDTESSNQHMSQIVTRNTRETQAKHHHIKTEESDITREQNADLTSEKRTSTKRDVEKHMNLTWKHKNREAAV